MSEFAFSPKYGDDLTPKDPNLTAKGVTLSNWPQQQNPRVERPDFENRFPTRDNMPKSRPWRTKKNDA